MCWVDRCACMCLLQAFFKLKWMAFNHKISIWQKWRLVTINKILQMSMPSNNKILYISGMRKRMCGSVNTTNWWSSLARNMQPFPISRLRCRSLVAEAIKSRNKCSTDYDTSHSTSFIYPFRLLRLRSVVSCCRVVQESGFALLKMRHGGCCWGNNEFGRWLGLRFGSEGGKRSWRIFEL